MVRIYQLRQKCIGCNACVEAASNRWRISRKDGRCTLVGGIEKGGIFRVDVEDDEFVQNKIAASNCPVKIIKIEIV